MSAVSVSAQPWGMARCRMYPSGASPAGASQVRYMEEKVELDGAGAEGAPGTGASGSVDMTTGPEDPDSPLSFMAMTRKM